MTGTFLLHRWIHRRHAPNSWSWIPEPHPLSAGVKTAPLAGNHRGPAIPPGGASPIGNPSIADPAIPDGSIAPRPPIEPEIDIGIGGIGRDGASIDIDPIEFDLEIDLTAPPSIINTPGPGIGSTIEREE